MKRTQRQADRQAHKIFQTHTYQKRQDKRQLDYEVEIGLGNTCVWGEGRQKRGGTQRGGG